MARNRRGKLTKKQRLRLKREKQATATKEVRRKQRIRHRQKQTPSIVHCVRQHSQLSDDVCRLIYEYHDDKEEVKVSDPVSFYCEEVTRIKNWLSRLRFDTEEYEYYKEQDVHVVQFIRSDPVYMRETMTIRGFGRMFEDIRATAKLLPEIYRRASNLYWQKTGKVWPMKMPVWALPNSIIHFGYMVNE